jgi:hypothetical protein
MAGWIKLVALFLFVFTLYDVSVPENCLEGVTSSTNTAQFRATHADGDRGSCQLEEDCLACAQILPGTHYVFAVTPVIAFAEPNQLLPAQAGIPALPYHPPRA